MQLFGIISIATCIALKCVFPGHVGYLLVENCRATTTKGKRSESDSDPVEIREKTREIGWTFDILLNTVLVQTRVIGELDSEAEAGSGSVSCTRRVLTRRRFLFATAEAEAEGRGREEVEAEAEAAETDFFEVFRFLSATRWSIKFFFKIQFAPHPP